MTDTNPATTVKVGPAETPYHRRDPKTGHRVATIWPVYSDGGKVGELWRDPSNGAWLAYRTGHGASLKAPRRDTRQAAAADAGWNIHQS